MPKLIKDVRSSIAEFFVFLILLLCSISFCLLSFLVYPIKFLNLPTYLKIDSFIASSFYPVMVGLYTGVFSGVELKLYGDYHLLLKNLSPDVKLDSTNTRLINLKAGSDIEEGEDIESLYPSSAHKDGNLSSIFPQTRKLPYENILFISNHVSYADWATITALIQKLNGIGRARFFMKDQLKQLPGIGQSCQLRNFFFVKRNQNSDGPKLEQQLGSMSKNNWPMQNILFPEGTFVDSTPVSKKILKSCREYCDSNLLKPLDYTLTPRKKGFFITSQSMRMTNTVVCDLTLVYTDSNCHCCNYKTAMPFTDNEKLHPPTNLSLLTRHTPLTCHMYVSVKNIDEEVPNSDEKANYEQLWKRFEIKQKLLEYFEKNDRFPGNEPVTCPRYTYSLLFRILSWFLFTFLLQFIPLFMIYKTPTSNANQLIIFLRWLPAFIFIIVFFVQTSILFTFSCFR